MRPHKIKSLFGLLPLFTVFLSSCVPTNAQPANIALGKPVTLNIQSTESYVKDKNPQQLTDGKYARDGYDATYKSRALWIQKGAIAWRVRNEPVIITVDLEKEMPISGVSFSTAAGTAGVQWPSAIGIFVSNDQKSWHFAGNLTDLSLKNGVPASEGYAVFRYITHDLKTKGRYVAFVVKQSPYTVTDEVEIFSGDSSWLAQPAPGVVLQKLDAASTANLLQSNFVRRRVAIDLQSVRQALETSSLSAAQKSTFTERLLQCETENNANTTVDNAVKTILPINDTHRQVMAIYGEILAAEKTAPIAIWQQHRYAWLPLVAKLNNNRVTLQIDALKNEIRSDSFLITNASGAEKSVTLQLNNPPTNAQNGWLQVNSVKWTDTHQGVPVADALIPVQDNQGKYEISIPAGFTRKVWITVDASKLNPGSYRSTFSVAGQQVPLQISVSKIIMQHPRLSLTLFDNSDSKSLQGVASRGITAENKTAALAMMKSHFVDSPWADRNILPWPTAADFNAQNELVKTLDFSAFDEWIKEWPDARYYFVFVNAKEKEAFADANRGAPEFDARLGAYAKVLSAHMKMLGLRPRQLSLLINDEPGIHGDWQDDVIADWARAIKKGAPELSLISDPTWKRPDLQKNQEAFTQMDILMPNTQIDEKSPKEVKGYFQKLRNDGTDLWLYACAGPVRLFDPQNYYRSQSWRVFQMGGKGMGFWAFNDIRTGMTSWNDYLSSTNFAPAFLDTNTVYNSVHWDAVREGVEDFEILSMLRDAIAKSQNATLKSQAQQILDEAVKASTTPLTTDLWSSEKQPQYMDEQLAKVRDILAKF